MNKKINMLICVTVFGILLSGCTIKRDISPIKNTVEKDICIIQDTKVRNGFLSAYTNTLNNIGYKVKVLPENSDRNSCMMTSTYYATWSWDLAIYMSYAKIDVFENSKLIGTALYDSRRGGANMSKFVSGDTMVKSLVEELFLGKKIDNK